VDESCRQAGASCVVSTLCRKMTRGDTTQRWFHYIYPTLPTPAIANPRLRHRRDKSRSPSKKDSTTLELPQILAQWPIPLRPIGRSRHPGGATLSLAQSRRRRRQSAASSPALNLECLTAPTLDRSQSGAGRARSEQLQTQRTWPIKR